MSTITPLTGLSHLDLSVSERHTSAQWYADVLGFEIRADRFNEHAQLPWVHLVHPCGLSAQEDVDAVVNDTAQATVLALRDLDGIQIEICSWKTQDSG